MLIDRSRTRIRALGFFKDVEVKNVPGSQPDRTNLTVNVTEQSTGSIQVGLGYSSTTSLLGEISYTQTNLFGRGQSMRASIQASYITKTAQFSFTEPYFLDRELAAGFDLYRVQTNYEQATYQSDVTAVVLRLGFPISEYSSVSLSYTYKIEKVSPYSGAPLDVLLAGGFVQRLDRGLYLFLQRPGRFPETDNRLDLQFQPGLRRVRRQPEVPLHHHQLLGL